MGSPKTNTGMAWLAFYMIQGMLTMFQWPLLQKPYTFENKVSIRKRKKQNMRNVFPSPFFLFPQDDESFIKLWRQYEWARVKGRTNGQPNDKVKEKTRKKLLKKRKATASKEEEEGDSAHGNYSFTCQGSDIVFFTSGHKTRKLRRFSQKNTKEVLDSLSDIVTSYLVIMQISHLKQFISDDENKKTFFSSAFSWHDRNRKHGNFFLVLLFLASFFLPLSNEPLRLPRAKQASYGQGSQDQDGEKEKINVVTIWKEEEAENKKEFIQRLATCQKCQQIEMELIWVLNGMWSLYISIFSQTLLT